MDKTANCLLILVTILTICKNGDAILDINLTEDSVKEITGVVKQSVEQILTHTDKISHNILNQTVPLVNNGYNTIENLTTTITNSADKNVEQVGKSLERISNNLVKVANISSSTAINVTSEMANVFKKGKYQLTVDLIGPYGRDGILIFSVAVTVIICFSVLCVQLKYIIPLIRANANANSPKKDKTNDKSKKKSQICRGDDHDKKDNNEAKVDMLSQFIEQSSKIPMDRCNTTTITTMPELEDMMSMETAFTTITMPETEGDEGMEPPPNMIQIFGKLRSVASLVNIFEKKDSK